MKPLAFTTYCAVGSMRVIADDQVSGSVSTDLLLPFVLARKPGKLPNETYVKSFDLEYGSATLEIHKNSVKKNEKALIVDDLIATGGTAHASAKLVEKTGGKIESFLFVINLFDLGGKDLLEKKSYKTISLIDFPGH